MREIPILVLATLAFFATTATAMEADMEVQPSVDASEATISLEYRAADEGVETEGLLTSAFGIRFMGSVIPLVQVNAAQRSEATPSDLELGQLLPFLVPVEGKLAETPATAPVAAEVVSIEDEGLSTSARASASGEGASAAADAAAGDHQVSQETAAPMPESPVDLGVQTEEEAAEPRASADEQAADPNPVSDAGAPPSAMLASSDAVAPIQPGLPELVATSVAVAGLTGSGLVFVPGVRIVVLRWLRRVFGLALFSRIAQEDILSHGRRAELFEFIKQNPGERIENTRRALGISNGSMHYHLKVLSERNLIRILRDRGLARLYPAGPKINPTHYVPAQRRRVVDLLSSRPGVTQREAAALLGISERMASYHIQRLSSQGLIEVRPEGARKRLFLRMTQLTPTPLAA